MAVCATTICACASSPDPVRPIRTGGAGTGYLGQDSIRERQDRLADSLAQIYAALDSDQRLVLEYKFFEPAFYHTDVPYICFKSFSETK